MTTLIETLDSELPVRGLRRLQADEARTECWERTAEPAARVELRRTKKRPRVAVTVAGVGTLRLARRSTSDPDAVLAALDALLGAAWRAGSQQEPSVVLSPIEPEGPGTAEAWAALVETLESQVGEAAELRERAAVAETQAASLRDEVRRLQARADETDAIAESLDKALAREADLALECDRLRHQADLLEGALADRRRQSGLFSDLARSVLAFLRRR